MLQAAKDAEKEKVDTREWGEFKFGDLFDLHGIKQAKSQKLIPTVVSSDEKDEQPYDLPATSGWVFFFFVQAAA